MVAVVLRDSMVFSLRSMTLDILTPLEMKEQFGVMQKLHIPSKIKVKGDHTWRSVGSDMRGYHSDRCNALLVPYNYP